jgi:hypothetical protein
MFFDHASTPVVVTRIPQSAEHPFQSMRLACSFSGWATQWAGGLWRSQDPILIVVIVNPF